MPGAGRLSGKTALVTGATGFIGAALARRLQGEGAVVHGLSRRPAPAGDACDRWWTADLVDGDATRRVLDAARPDLVFHLASQVAGAREVEHVLPMLHANLVGTVNLLAAAAQPRGPRVLLAGSMEEPPTDGRWPVPASPYAAAKLAAGAYARMFHALYGTPAVCLRIFMVYGPGQPDTRKLVPYVTTSLLRDEAPALSSGARRVDWIYVDDVVEAFVAAAVAEGVEGRTIDVGSGELVTVRSVVERLVALIRPSVAPRFGAVAERALEQEPVADPAPAAALLGWRPRVPLDEGLRRTVAWYRELGRTPGVPKATGVSR